MRRFTGALLAAVIVPTIIALPTLPRPAAAPRPVAPTLRTVPLAVTGPLAARATGSPQVTAAFSTVAVSWAWQATPPDISLSVRTRSRGAWTGWVSLGGPDDVVANTGSADGRRQSRGGTSPVYVGASDGVQTRIDSVRGPLPKDLRVVLIDAGSSPADATLGQSTPPGSAAAYAAQPAIVTRAQWGADERLRPCFSGYTSTVKVGFVHHTASPNGYAPGEAAAMVRGIYAYHVLSNGWCDIGYNYLVDAYGRTYEGRWGGTADKNVLGAHTGGFNEDTFAASLLGDFTALTPPPAMLTALERLFAWKLGRYYLDPLGTQLLTAAPFSGSKYPAGAVVRFNTISGHRDADYSTCPGDAAYAQLPNVRRAVRLYMGAAMFSPSLSATTVPVGGTVTVRAGLSGPSAYRVSAVGRCGAPAGVLSGTAASSIAQPWRATRPGRYTLTLTAGSAWPYTAQVTVLPPANPPPPAGSAGPPGPDGFVPITPVRVFDTRRLAGPLGPAGRLDARVLGIPGVPTSGVSAVVLNLTGVCPDAPTWLAAVPGGVASPTTSSLNLAPGDTRAALVTVPVGAQGMVSAFARGGFVDAVGDVVGYYVPGTAGSRFHPLTPTRVLDTRRAGGAFGRGETRALAVGPAYGVPASATAVILNVTAVDGSNGFLSVWPYGLARPNTSSVNITGPTATPNRVVSGLRSGRVSVFNAGGPVNVVVDLVGWYAPPSVPGGTSYHPLAPTRVLDTRSGVGGRAGPVLAGTSLTLPVAGTGRVVPAGARAVVMTLTATESTNPTVVTAYPAGSALPGTSDLNVARGTTYANLVVVPLGAAGGVSLYSSTANVQLVGDVLGWFG